MWMSKEIYLFQKRLLQRTEFQDLGFTVLSTFLLLWFIVTISTCDNTGLCGLCPHQYGWQITLHIGCWFQFLINSVFFLLWSIISWGISGYWLKVYSWKGVDDTHLLTWKMLLMLQMKTFDGFLTVLKFTIFWFSAFIIWFGKCY